MRVFTTMPPKIKSRLKKTAAYAAVAVFWILVWQIASVVVNQEILLPSPAAVLSVLQDLIVTVEFWIAIFATIIRILLGFALGVVFGTAMAAATYKFTTVRMLFYPFLSAVRAVPVASFIILALVWFKTWQLSVVVTFLMTVPVIWSNVFAGIKSTDPKLLEMGKVFGFGKMKMIRLIIIPAVFPFFISATATALGFAWKSGVAAEVIGASSGTIGGQLYESKIYLETPSMFAWTLTVILLSILLEKNFAAMTALTGKIKRRYMKPFKKAGQTVSAALSALSKPPQIAKTGKKPLLSIQSISKSYGKIRVLDNFSFNFPQSGIVYITGRSGSGKTTLLRLIAGLEAPDSGEINFNLINGGNSKISVVFQEDRLLAKLNVLENTSVASSAEAAQHQLAIAGLADKMYSPVSDLSGGMVRRVSLARSLAYGGDLFLMDEPFKGIDEKSLAPILKEIEKISRTTLVIIVTHDQLQPIKPIKSENSKMITLVVPEEV
ncbi:MAG: ATP-binding cassette domain-containing protein [Oscillospiraceae bacterium]|nr:ATP-binding cassette domain-containing protein [Oscillospiraceae bacterium]